MTDHSHTHSETHPPADRDPALITLSEVRYAGGILLVDEDICAALFDFALALSKARQSAAVTVPSIVAGVKVDSHILIGPTSQFWCAPADGVFPDISDETKVREIRGEISGLAPPVAVAAHPAPADDFEYGL